MDPSTRTLLRLQLTIIFILSFGNFVLGIDVSCKTPNNESGRCIILSACPPLMSLLTGKQPLSPTTLRFLQRSTCSTVNEEPYACCPLSALPTVPTTPKPTQATTTTTAAPVTQSAPRAPASNYSGPISSHPNVNLLPSTKDCGQSLLEEHIAGGTDAGLGHFPWMALLGFNVVGADAPMQFACGGTLINSRYVLTAAHCVSGLPEGFKLLVVRLGEYNTDEKIDCDGSLCAPPVQDIPVEFTIPHPSYDKKKRKENDIAIVRLAQPAALGPFVRPICLPHGERLQKVGNSPQPIVAGWGRTVSDNPDQAKILQMVKVPFVVNDKCNSFYKQELGDSVDEGRFCAGGVKGMDSCRGDSGGPLMLPFRAKSVEGAVRVFQFGIVSLGPSKCETAGLPALYTKVSYFMPWILDNLYP